MVNGDLKLNKKSVKIDENDAWEKYCPKLGHTLTFHYCRRESILLPCSRIIDCWKEKLKIKEFLDNHFSFEDKKNIFKPAKTKILSLFELIQNARQNQSK